MESNPNCRAVLASRMKDNLLDHGEIASDVRTFQPSKKVADEATGAIGGFPCQAACMISYYYAEWMSCWFLLEAIHSKLFQIHWIGHQILPDCSRLVCLFVCLKSLLLDWLRGCRCVAKGISTAGLQLGLNDKRSALITEVFRILDCLPLLWLRCSKLFSCIAECHVNKWKLGRGNLSQVIRYPRECSGPTLGAASDEGTLELYFAGKTYCHS